MTIDGKMTAKVLWNHPHMAQIMRLVSMAIALPLSWFQVWAILVPFDFIALTATIVGGYPMFSEELEGIRSRRMVYQDQLFEALKGQKADNKCDHCTGGINPLPSGQTKNLRQYAEAYDPQEHTGREAQNKVEPVTESESKQTTDGGRKKVASEDNMTFMALPESLLAWSNPPPEF